MEICAFPYIDEACGELVSLELKCPECKGILGTVSPMQYIDDIFIGTFIVCKECQTIFKLKDKPSVVETDFDIDKYDWDVVGIGINTKDNLDYILPEIKKVKSKQWPIGRDYEFTMSQWMRLCLEYIMDYLRDEPIDIASFRSRIIKLASLVLAIVEGIDYGWVKNKKEEY